MSSKIDKNALKGPDVFQSTSDRVFAWIEANVRVIGGAFALVLVVAIGYVSYKYFSARKEAQAATEIYAAEAGLKKLQQETREARALNPGKPAPALDYAKDFAPHVSKLKAEIEKNSGARAALVSALNLVAFLVQQKQFGEALAVLEIPRYRPGSGDVLAGFYNMHRGLVFLENGKYDDARSAYEDILKSSALKHFHPEALLKQGLAFELQGDANRARETYEKLRLQFPESEAAKTAQRYIRLLETKATQGAA